MADIRYYIGDADDLYHMTREQVIEATFEFYWEAESAYQDLLDDIYGVVTIAGMEFDTGRALRDLDPIAFRCGVSESTSEIDPDNYPPADDEEGE